MDETSPTSDEEEPIASGVFQGGTLSVFEEYVSIERSSRSMFEDKHIEMTEIYGVEYTDGFVTGHLQIKQTEMDLDSAGLLSHPVDENTLYFPRNKRTEARRVRDAIIERASGEE